VIAGTTAHIVDPGGGGTVELPPSVLGTVQVKLGVPTNPLSRVNTRVPLPQEPLFTVSWVGAKPIEKSTAEEALAVLAGLTEVHCVTKTNASIDPKPVAKSYPGKAL